MVWIKYQDIQLAFDFVGSAPPYSNNAYVSLDTGEIFWVSDWIDLDETPDDLDSADRYIEIPHKNELGLARISHQRAKRGRGDAPRHKRYKARESKGAQSKPL